MRFIFESTTVFTLLFSFLIMNQSHAALHPEMQKLIPGNLIDLNGNQVSNQNLQGKIIGLYFSAGWCPPCRSFSPVLKDFRNRNKEEFEVVMVSADRSRAEQLKYMQDMNMEWSALPQNSTESSNLYGKYGVRGIPTLIILSPNGKTISSEGRTEVNYNSGTILSNWKNSPVYEKVDNPTPPEGQQPTTPATGTNANPNPSSAPTFTPPVRTASTLDEEVKSLREENAKKDALIAELTKRADECEKLAIDYNASCASISQDLIEAETKLASALADNQALEKQASECKQISDACSMEIIQLREQLQQCQSLANAPFLRGWIYSDLHGWVYTDENIFPYVYLESTSTWYFYEVGSSSPARYFNYSDQSWEVWK